MITALSPAGSRGPRNVVVSTPTASSTAASAFTYTAAPAWATVLEWYPNPAVVTDASLRAAILASNLPWRVVDTATNIELLLVPPGVFMRGCSPGDTECRGGGYETPAHQVTLTNAFYLGKTEVTVGQYGGGGSSLPQTGGLSCNSAQSFCTARGFRLPTSAEWEWACRGGTTTARYGVLNDIAWYSGNSGGTRHTVATKLPNALGFYDMLGNVYEFASDHWEFYSSDAPVVNPQGPASGAFIVIRGGAFTHTRACSRASDREGAGEGQSAEVHLGFRVARTP